MAHTLNRTRVELKRAQRVGDRQQVAVRRVVARGNVVALAVLDLRAPPLRADVNRKVVLGAVRGAYYRIRALEFELRVGAVNSLEESVVCRGDLPQFDAPARGRDQQVSVRG